MNVICITPFVGKVVRWAIFLRIFTAALEKSSNVYRVKERSYSKPVQFEFGTKNTKSLMQKIRRMKCKILGTWTFGDLGFWLLSSNWTGLSYNFSEIRSNFGGLFCLGLELIFFINLYIKVFRIRFKMFIIR